MIDKETLRAQLEYTLDEARLDLPGVPQRGKVREAWSREGRRLIVTTDRVSAFDRVLTTIPFKGQVLNQLAIFWFEHTGDIVPNHLVSQPDPNAVVVRDLEPIMVELVVRGYLTGMSSTSAWTHYARGEREFCGNRLPEGMSKDQRFAAPIVTPSTKAELGGHDESVSPAEIVERGIVSRDLMDRLQQVGLALFRRGTETAGRQGVILVDTKYEFGLSGDELVLMDEIHTPDSSRFWYADDYRDRFERGEEQRRIDKDYIRGWLAERGFTGEGEVPRIPDDVRIEAARRYIEAYEAITGRAFEAAPGPVLERLRGNISDY